MGNDNKNEHTAACIAWSEATFATGMATVFSAIASPPSTLLVGTLAVGFAFNALRLGIKANKIKKPHNKGEMHLKK